MIRSTGLTLVEVMIAVLVLGVGVLAAAGLQTSALQATRSAQATQQLASIARSELDVARGTRYGQTEPETNACTTRPTGCHVDVAPCTVSGGGSLDCTLALVATPDAHLVTVTVAADTRSVRVQTVVLR